MPPCRSCGEEWTFSVLEQALFVEKGYKHDPSRCKACRDRRKARRQRENRDHDRYHVGICGDCGGEARVPFQPRPGRPIFCSHCFRAHRRTG